jgi:STE24 endopeptidase
MENGLDRSTNGRSQIEDHGSQPGARTLDGFRRMLAIVAIIIAGFLSMLLLAQWGCWRQPVSAAQAAVTSPSANPISAATALAQGYTLSKEQYARAIAYARAGYRLYFVSAAYQIAILVAILLLRLGPAYRNVAERVSSRRFIQAAIFATLLIATISVLQLPVAMYDHSLSVEFDQSIQRWPSWFWDQVKSLALSLIFASIGYWILYGVIRRSPRRWWFYFWLAMIPPIVFLTIIAPVVIAPMFNRFDPLQARESALVGEIGKVLARGRLEIPPERMFEMKASEKMKSLNAYVTGFGPSKRVVVYDTTIERMTTPEILFVFGHEMGHYVLHHIIKQMLIAGVFSLIGTYLAFRWMNFAVPRLGARWGIRSQDDWASLPALLLFLSVAGFLATPLQSAISRHFEHVADIYGLEIIHGIVPDSANVAAHALQVLGEVDLSDPNPSAFIRFWLYTHPPLNERILFARSYDRWSRGESPLDRPPFAKGGHDLKKSETPLSLHRRSSG